MAKAPASTKPTPKEWIGRLLIAGWIIVTVVLLALLALEHNAALPSPGNQKFLTHAALQLRRASGRNFLVHVIYSECSCSRSLFTHLVKRGPFAGDEEMILLVGFRTNQAERVARGAGFELVNISAADLVSRFGLEAAPVLLVFDPAGNLRYGGGYYDNPATVSPLDEKIRAQVASGQYLQALPVFGCAVSPRLQKSLDPLRLISSPK